MKTRSSAWQPVQFTRSACEGGTASSAPHARHLKCIIGLMKPLLVMLLVAVSVQAQSIADVARKERERQAKLKPTLVVVSNQTITNEEPKPTTPPDQAKPEDAKAATTEPSKDAKAQAPPVDPVQAWNNRLAQLRDRLRTLQDQETALQLQLNQANNQVYAPVTDPATQQRALAQVGQIQLQLSAVRKELDDTRKALDSMQLQGPPKK